MKINKFVFVFVILSSVSSIFYACKKTTVEKNYCYECSIGSKTSGNYYFANGCDKESVVDSKISDYEKQNYSCTKKAQ